MRDLADLIGELLGGLLIMAAVGCLAIFAAIGYGIYWLITVIF